MGCTCVFIRLVRSGFIATCEFADTTGGAKASANLYSLVESRKANGVDAYRYLTELFKALPYARSADDYEALLPWTLGQRGDDTAA